MNDNAFQKIVSRIDWTVTKLVNLGLWEICATVEVEGIGFCALTRVEDEVIYSHPEAPFIMGTQVQQALAMMVWG